MWMGHVTHSCVWHDLFTHDMLPSRVTWLIHMWNASFRSNALTWIIGLVTWFIFLKITRARTHTHLKIAVAQGQKASSFFVAIHTSACIPAFIFLQFFWLKYGRGIPERSLQGTSYWKKVLQCVAAYCSVLQYVAVCCHTSTRIPAFIFVSFCWSQIWGAPTWKRPARDLISK